jgi:hypothetical protein
VNAGQPQLRGGRPLRMLALAFAFTSATAFASSAPAAAAQTTVDFKNFSYDVTPCNPGRVEMHSGEGEQDVNGTALSLYLEQVLYGELAPGRRFAVVRLSCSPPVGSESAAYLYAIDAGKATYVTTLVDLFVGEGHMSSGWIHLRFQNDLLYVDHCLSDEDCENGVVTTYALRHGKVVAVYTLHHKYKM